MTNISKAVGLEKNIKVSFDNTLCPVWVSEVFFAILHCKLSGKDKNAHTNLSSDLHNQHWRTNKEYFIIIMPQEYNIREVKLQKWHYTYHKYGFITSSTLMMELNLVTMHISKVFLCLFRGARTQPLIVLYFPRLDILCAAFPFFIFRNTVEG